MLVYCVVGAQRPSSRLPKPPRKVICASGEPTTPHRRRDSLRPRAGGGRVRGAMAAESQRTLPIALGVAFMLLLSWFYTSNRAAQDTKAVTAHANYGRGKGGYRPIAPLPTANSIVQPSVAFYGGTSSSTSPPPPPEPAAASSTEAAAPDPWDAPELRRQPRVREALRQALRESLLEAERNASADPLELLAQRLLRRRDPRRAPPAVVVEAATGVSTAAHEGATSIGGLGDPSPAGVAASRDPCIGRGGRLRRRCADAALQYNGTGPRPLLRYPPVGSRRHNLPPKLPTGAMWPPLPKPAATDAPDDFRSLGRACSPLRSTACYPSVARSTKPLLPCLSRTDRQLSSHRIASQVCRPTAEAISSFRATCARRRWRARTRASSSSRTATRRALHGSPTSSSLCARLASITLSSS